MFDIDFSGVRFQISLLFSNFDIVVCKQNQKLEN